MVSVIIPNYNHAVYLKQRIQSVLNQTYQNFEIIILDDCSTDNSRQLIELFRENEKIQAIIYNDVNSGSTFKQWEKGIKIANGEYIWIAESDDFCSETFLESALDNLMKYNSSLHYCQSSLVDENNAVVEHTLLWPASITSINWKQPFVMKGKEFIKKALQYKNVIPNASAVVFLKKNFDFSGITAYRVAGDWLFWINNLLSSDISYSPQILNSFRSHSSTTRNLNTRIKMMRYYIEVLSIKYKLKYKYYLGEKSEIKKILKECIYVCSIKDISYFKKFSIELKLPKRFLIQFLLTKFFVNRYTRKLFHFGFLSF